jgi:hypothetical protein
MCTEIPPVIGFRTLSIPTGFVVHVLGLKSGAEPAHRPPVGNHLFSDRPFSRPYRVGYSRCGWKADLRRSLRGRRGCADSGCPAKVGEFAWYARRMDITVATLEQPAGV